MAFESAGEAVEERLVRRGRPGEGELSAKELGKSGEELRKEPVMDSASNRWLGKESQGHNLILIGCDGRGHHSTRHFRECLFCWCLQKSMLLMQLMECQFGLDSLNQ